MQIKEIELPSQSLDEEIKPYLKDQIFHVTTFENFKGIEKDGFISVNSDNNTYSQSKECFARKYGVISLWDFIDKSEQEIQEIFDDGNLSDLLQKSKKNVILFLGKPHYAECEFLETAQNKKMGRNTVSWKKTEGRTFIPHLECWYPGDLSICKIQAAINIKIIPQKKETKILTFNLAEGHEELQLQKN